MRVRPVLVVWMTHDCAGSCVTRWARSTALSHSLGDKVLVGATSKRKIIPGSGLETQTGIAGRPKGRRKPRSSQGAEIPFKELQVLWRRPQLLEAGTCPHAGMVIHQVLQVGVHLKNNGRGGVVVNQGPPKSPASGALEDRV